MIIIIIIDYRNNYYDSVMWNLKMTTPDQKIIYI